MNINGDNVMLRTTIPFKVNNHAVYFYYSAKNDSSDLNKYATRPMVDLDIDFVHIVNMYSGIR